MPEGRAPWWRDPWRWAARAVLVACGCALLTMAVFACGVFAGLIFTAARSGFLLVAR